MCVCARALVRDRVFAISYSFPIRLSYTILAQVKREIEEKARFVLTFESKVAQNSMDIASAIAREAKLQVSLMCTCKDAHLPRAKTQICHARGSILLLSRSCMHTHACQHARPWTFARNEACMHRSGNLFSNVGNLFSNVRGPMHTYKQDTLTNAHAHIICAPFP